MVNVTVNRLLPDEKALFLAALQAAHMKWQPHTVGGLPSSNMPPCSSVLLIAFLYRFCCLIVRRRTLCLPPHR